MRIEQLKYLIDLSHTHSISKTAQNFFITQQGVSDALKKLEKEFDVELFTRTKYGVLLTSIGEYFAARAQEISAIHQDLIQKASECHNFSLLELNEELFLMAHSRIYQHILPSVIQNFCLHCPHVKLRVLEGSNRQIIESCQNAHTELGLISVSATHFQKHYIDAYADTLTFEQLFADELVVCVSKDSPLARKTIISNADLTHIPLITYDYNLATEAPHFYPKHQNTIFTASDHATHRKLVAQNLAVDVMSRFEYRLLFSDNNDFTAIPLKKDRIIIALVTRQEHSLSPSAAHFIKLLRQFNYA